MRHGDANRARSVPFEALMLASFDPAGVARVVGLSFLLQGAAAATEEAIQETRLAASFETSCEPLAVVSGAPAFERGAIGASGDVALVLAGPEALVGDLEIALRVAAPPTRLVLEVGAHPAVRLELQGRDVVLLAGAARTEANGDLAAGAELRLMIRSRAVECYLGDAPLAFAEAQAPIGGGRLRIELEGGGLDDLAVRSLPWRERDRVTGASPEELAALAGRPLEDFTLVGPRPGRLDPVYRVVVSGREAPFVVHGRGVRRSDSEIPPLEQALALAQVRPWLRLRMLEGRGEGEREMASDAASGAFVVGEAPGIVVVDALCGVLGAPPSLTILDADRDRVLDRVLPGGPAIREAWSTIPRECTQLRVLLHAEGMPPVERIVEVKRQ
jgi:hypothetical protein